MVDLHAAVMDYLSGRNWPYEDHDGVIVTPVLAKSGSWTAIFEIRDDDQVLIVSSLVPVSVPVDRRTDVALYIARANLGLMIGHFEINLDDGEVRFRTSVDVAGAELSEPLIDHLFLANVVGVDRYLDGLRAVIEGTDPAAAIDFC